MLEMQLPGKLKRRTQKRRYWDVVKEDIQEVGVRENEVFDSSLWGISFGDP